jgi:hypothetical protein
MVCFQFQLAPLRCGPGGDGVRVVSVAERRVAVSKIIGSWYAGDFGADPAARLRLVAGYMPEAGAYTRPLFG